MDTTLNFKKGNLSTKIIAVRTRETDQLLVIVSFLYLGKPRISDTTAYHDCTVGLSNFGGGWRLIFTPEDDERHATTRFLTINSDGDIKSMNF